MTDNPILGAIPEQNLKLEEPPKHEHIMPLSVSVRIISEIEDVPKGVGIAFTPFEYSDSDIAEAETRDVVLDKVTSILLKLGLTENDIELAFGIEPSAIRKAKKPKKNNGNNGKALGKT